VGALGVAGCSGGGGGDGGDGGDGSDGGDGGDGGSGQNLGERVETITLEYWTSASSTEIMEQMTPIMKQNLQQRLGVQVEIVPKEIGAQIGDSYADERTHHLGFWSTLPSLRRLDPNYLMSQMGNARLAGPDGSGNSYNWVNCDYADLFYQQQTAGTIEERHELVNEAMQIASENAVDLTLLNIVIYNAINTDNVEPNRLGAAGITTENPLSLVYSEPKGKERITFPTFNYALESPNFPAAPDQFSRAIWSGLVHEPLIRYDENFETKNDLGLATAVEIEDDSRRYTIELRDATFHDGDPITAEDVKFTYDHLSTHQADFVYPEFPESMSSSIVDDSTVEFTFDDPYLGFYTIDLPVWGILKKDLWEPASDDPTGFEPDPIVGSGPFTVNTFERNSALILDPFEDHPVFDVSHGLTLQAFQGDQAKFQAFQAGEIDVNTFMRPAQFNKVAEQDNVMNASQVSYTPFHLKPQCQFGPTQFREFRDAAGAAFDRQELNEVGLYGESTEQLHSCPMLDPHQWRPPEDTLHKFTDDPQGDEERARQVLGDAGWGWDDDGNLHYPPDADLSPVWPKGENPDPEEFPCMEG
jgi:peptide/nickel transport system substrate-binding protein